MANIRVIGTGGTIASTRQGGDAATAATSAKVLAEGLGGAHLVTTREALTTGSYLLTPGNMRSIVEAIAEAAADPAVDGIVVTHGTDTMEESAFLAALCAPRAVPVVFTGAQRTADSVAPDGPGNLSDAITFAAEPTLAAHGALIAFGGVARTARGARKAHTTDPSPFAGGIVAASLRGGSVVHEARAARDFAQLSLTSAYDHAVVDIITAYPGLRPEAIDRAREAGAAAIVLAGTGVGNAGQGIADRVATAVSGGCQVLLSTRVPWGPVVPTYGNGGGIDLVAAGAIPSGELNPFQTRILAAVLLSEPQATTASFSRRFHAYL